MDKSERRKLRAALTRFENAVRAEEMKGAQPPEDHYRIETGYYRSKATLLRKLGLDADALMYDELAEEVDS